MYTVNTACLCFPMNAFELFIKLQDDICCADFHPQGDNFAIGFANGTWAVYTYILQTQLYIFEEEINSAITTVRFSTIGNFLAVATKVSKFEW